jgi:hypothetical protein
VLQEDSAQFASHKIRFPASRPDYVSYRSDARLFKASSVQTIWFPVRTPTCESIIRPDDVDSRPDLPMFREASNCTSLHLSGRFNSPSGRHSVFDQALGFLSKTKIWEDYCNRPDDVDSCPEVLIHKASIAIQIHHPSGCYGFPSGRPPAKASSVRTTWIPVRTFLCVEKLRTAPACICPDVSAAHPDDTQCSTKL